MSRFLEDAGSILEAAVSSSGAEDCAILIRPEGGIHMVMGSDWPLHSLQSLHGARTAYSVHRDRARVRVEGRSLNQSCSLQIDSPALVLQQFLGGREYLLAAAN